MFMRPPSEESESVIMVMTSVPPPTRFSQDGTIERCTPTRTERNSRPPKLNVQRAGLQDVALNDTRVAS
jgi:hypothetical protein